MIIRDPQEWEFNQDLEPNQKYLLLLNMFKKKNQKYMMLK